MPIYYSVAFNGQKFCIQENRCFGWKSNTTHFGSYDTFAEAYTAALDKALDLQRYQSEIEVMDEQANKKKLLSSWGINKEQRAELEQKAPLAKQLSLAETRKSSTTFSPKEDINIER